LLKIYFFFFGCSPGCVGGGGGGGDGEWGGMPGLKLWKHTRRRYRETDEG
jgi:hypothetical protein